MKNALSNSVNLKDIASEASRDKDAEVEVTQYGGQRRLNTSHIGTRDNKAYQRKENPTGDISGLDNKFMRAMPHLTYGNTRAKKDKKKSKDVIKRGDSKFRSGEHSLTNKQNVTHNNIITANNVIINYSGDKPVEQVSESNMPPGLHINGTITNSDAQSPVEQANSHASEGMMA